VKTLHIAPGSPWENGYNESFNCRLRDELLDGEIFYTLKRGRSDDRGLAVPLQHRPPARPGGIPRPGRRARPAGGTEPEHRNFIPGLAFGG
jgi:hypothetical protein